VDTLSTFKLKKESHRTSHRNAEMSTWNNETKEDQARPRNRSSRSSVFEVESADSLLAVKSTFLTKWQPLVGDVTA